MLMQILLIGVLHVIEMLLRFIAKQVAGLIC